MQVRADHHSAPAQSNSFVYLIENIHFNNLYICPYISKGLARINLLVFVSHTRYKTLYTYFTPIFMGFISFLVLLHVCALDAFDEFLIWFNKCLYLSESNTVFECKKIFITTVLLL